MIPNKIIALIKAQFSSQLRINMASGLLMTILNAPLMIVAYPVYLHFLGYEQYGVWLVLSTILTFAQLGNLGIGPAITKLVAEDFAQHNSRGIQQYVTAALAMLSISGILVLSVILLLKVRIIAWFNLNDDYSATALDLLTYIGILSVYVFIVQVFEAILTGLGRMDLTHYIHSLSRGINIAVAAFLLMAGFGIKSLLIGSVLSYVFIHAASFVCIRRILHVSLLNFTHPDISRFKRLLHFGGAVFGGSLISLFLSPFNKLILSRYAGISTVPVYEIAYHGSMQVRALMEVGLRALMPEISRIGAVVTPQAKNKIQALNRRAVKFIVFFGTPLYAVLILLAGLLLKLWLKHEFTEAMTGVFRIMSAGTYLSLLCVPAYYTLMGLGKVHFCLASQVIQGAANVLMICTILFFSGTVSVHSVVTVVMVSMGLTTVYVILQNRRVMQQFLNHPVNPDSFSNNRTPMDSFPCIED